ncbi:hypothetical protein [Azospirillum tabaci]|nr:hypothetical protein [Azospirillum tabaci]
MTNDPKAAQVASAIVTLLRLLARMAPRKALLCLELAEQLETEFAKEP